MADIALLGNSSGDVVGIGGALVILHVTSDASRLRALISSSDVTCRAVQLGMHASQGVPGDLQVVKAGTGPGGNRVALLAGGGERRSHVIGRSGLLVILRVTGVALERQTLKLSGGGSFMTGIAFQRGMRSHQREPVLVILNRLQGNRPAAHVVTTFAVGPHLAAVDVGVTVGAPGACVGEDHLGMAPGTGHAFVRPCQGIACLVMVEFRNGADRLPTHRGVAVLTGDLQSTMRAARGGIILRLPQSKSCRQDQETQNCVREKHPRQQSAAAQPHV